MASRKPADCERLEPCLPEIDQCTGSSLTGAGHSAPPRVTEVIHDYIAWYMQRFYPNR
jgi:hypothetical protein